MKSLKGFITGLVFSACTLSFSEKSNANSSNEAALYVGFSVGRTGLLNAEKSHVEWAPYFSGEYETPVGLFYIEDVELGVAFPIYQEMFTSFAIAPMFATERQLINGIIKESEHLSLGGVWRVGYQLGSQGYLSTGFFSDMESHAGKLVFIDNSIPLSLSLAFNSWLAYGDADHMALIRGNSVRKSGVKEIGISLEKEFNLITRLTLLTEMGAVYQGYEQKKIEEIIKLTLAIRY